MTHRFADIAFTPTVKQVLERLGSRKAYARNEEVAEPFNHQLTEAEAGFIAARDSLYMASVGETGWPYIQHRGGPAGFARVLDPQTIGFADFRGNRHERPCPFALNSVDRRNLLQANVTSIHPSKLITRLTSWERCYFRFGYRQTA